MTTTLRIAAVCAVLVMIFGCKGGKEESAEKASETMESTAAEPASEPDFVTVQHILVGFEGSVPGKPITRTKEEAATLAAELLERAQGGEDFGALVKEYTDDAFPGIYKMANHGVQPGAGEQVFPRGRMVPAFGDVGFPLTIGGVGMAAYDPQKSPYGWHVIKRIE
jgi:hypothetical protein